MYAGPNKKLLSAKPMTCFESGGKSPIARIVDFSYSLQVAHLEKTPIRSKDKVHVEDYHIELAKLPEERCIRRAACSGWSETFPERRRLANLQAEPTASERLRIAVFTMIRQSCSGSETTNETFRAR